MIQTKQFTLLYILGSGHSGSTLLDMLLNAHSEITGLGELVALRRYIILEKEGLSEDRPGDWQEVKTNVLSMPLWQKLRQCYQARRGIAFTSLAEACSYPNFRVLIHKWNAADMKRYTFPWHILFACVYEALGAKIITDTSKFPHRLYILKRSGLFKVKVIHLIRDGRGVINSFYRKYGSFWLGLQRWMYPSLESLYVRRLFTNEDWMTLRYEELATNPEEQLVKICSFLDLEFEGKMLSFRSTPYIGIGGNRMREQQTEEQIVLDKRWLRELSSKHRLAFALIAGWLNKFYGYRIL